MKRKLTQHSNIRLLLLLALLTGCARAPVAAPPATPASRDAAEFAIQMVGKPYRYGGATTQGFDCSGLVYFSFQRAGIKVPRSTSRLYKQGKPVATTNTSRGDLVFFDQEGKAYSHVGIYLGNDRFVHAPSTGKRVRVDSLTDPYWRKHWVGVRRF